MRIVFDIKQKRPGCALLQGAMRGDIHAVHRFPTESWLTAPTPDMRAYETSEEQLEMLVAYVKKNFPEKKRRR